MMGGDKVWFGKLLFILVFFGQKIKCWCVKFDNQNEFKIKIWQGYFCSACSKQLINDEMGEKYQLHPFLVCDKSINLGSRHHGASTTNVKIKH
jgi:hypothetical protein